jgi:membrane-associated protein
MQALLDLILHFDRHLQTLVGENPTLAVVVLIAIVFCETGLVFTPFLPGDSLLFAAGALAGTGQINIGLLLVTLSIAAILGDTVNYHLGKWIGPRMPLVKQKHLDRTHAFFEKYGGKAIILARFVPIVRTFAPFVAGMGAMNYRRFIQFNVIGGLVWVFLFLLAGYWFGQHPFVQKNFKLVIVAIIVISILPMVFEFIKAKMESRRNTEA